MSEWSPVIDEGMGTSERTVHHRPAPEAPAVPAAAREFDDSLRHVVACAVGYGMGGLGQHFAHVVEETRAHHAQTTYFTPAGKPDDGAGRAIDSRLSAFLL